MTMRALAIATVLIASCSPLRGCVEAQFTLAAESRLPKWAPLPPGVSREDVTVQLTYYTPPTNVDNAVFEARYKGGKTIEVTGEMCWHPVMEAKKNKHGGFDGDSYPHYVYVRTQYGVEVIEHWPMPTFKFVDDPVLVKQAEATARCNKG